MKPMALTSKQLTGTLFISFVTGISLRICRSSISLLILLMRLPQRSIRINFILYIPRLLRFKFLKPEDVNNAEAVATATK